jgi:hypothetical protein
VAGFNEHCNDVSGSIQGGELLPCGLVGSYMRIIYLYCPAKVRRSSCIVLSTVHSGTGSSISQY